MEVTELSHISKGMTKTKSSSALSSPPQSPSHCKSTVLHPFDHQVGGHTQLMLLDQNTLCKPLVQRELSFYLNIPQELQEFVPKYKGVVEVRQMDECPILYHPIKGSIRDTDTNTNTSCGLRRNSHSQPELRVQICSCNDQRLLQKDFIHERPWSNTEPCYSSRPSQRYFILLENIAYRYRLPCILDLKMGTRQHGDDASDEKRHRQMAKCEASTSASLGVRLCGMQVYKPQSGGYQLFNVDKYYGRKINSEIGLRRELEVYFNGRTSLISAIINRLKELRSKILELRVKFKFYSTSLLIVSEGCVGSRNSNSTRKRHNSSSGDDDEDSSLDSMDSSIEMDTHHGRGHEQRFCSVNYKCNHMEHLRHLKNQFDIRMIDFAHTSSSASSSSTDGFLIGLDNLIRLLTEIQVQEFRCDGEVIEDSDDSHDDFHAT